MLTEGQEVDRFTVLAMLGKGGCATVYKVRHRALGTLHALKLLHAHHAELAPRFVQEGRIQARLQSPHVVAVTDVIDVSGAPALLLELVEGPTLGDHIRGRQVPIEEALRFFRQMLAGVSAAHAIGVLHRDLKPGNVMLAQGPRGLVAKVTDFGIAKLIGESSAVNTMSGSMLGTPGYMAPEQLSDPGSTDERADVFSLGAILYEMLAGVQPFAKMGPMATAMAVARGDYVRLSDRVPGVPVSVAVAVGRALLPEPADRFDSCGAFCEAIDGSRPPWAAAPRSAVFDDRDAALSKDATESIADAGTGGGGAKGPGDHGYIVIRPFERGPPTNPTAPAPPTARVQPRAPGTPVRAPAAKDAVVLSRGPQRSSFGAVLSGLALLLAVAVCGGFFEGGSGARAIDQVLTERSAAEQALAQEVDSIVGLGSRLNESGGGAGVELFRVLDAWRKKGPDADRIGEGRALLLELQAATPPAEAMKPGKEEALRTSFLSRIGVTLGHFDEYDTKREHWRRVLDGTNVRFAVTFGFAPEPPR